MLLGGEENLFSLGRNKCQAGLKNRGKRKVWAPRALPQTLGDLCLLPGPSSWTFPAWFPGPHRSPSNLQSQPIGPNLTVASQSSSRGAVDDEWLISRYD